MTVQGKKGKVGTSGDAPTKKKGKRTEAPATTTEPVTSEALTDAPPAAAATPSRRGKKRAAEPTEPASLNVITPGHDAKLPEEPPEPTLADLATGYLAHLEASGKSPGTVASYGLELAVAMEELGKDTPASQLTAERVQAFFESERVTRARSGRSKSPLSIAKTTRVLRQALAWGVARGIVDTTGVPAA